MLATDGYSAELSNNLSALIEGGRVPHAMIIDGGSSVKRGELALSLASALVCNSTEQKPCNHCNSCKKVKAGFHPDVIMVEAEDKKKTISVDVIRKMREDAYILPNEASKKIYIVKQADTMQPYAQNALLKVLEEPPKYASFILLCDYHTALLPTVLSRCVVFNIGVSALQEISHQKEEKAQELAIKIASAISKKDEYELLIITSEFEKNTELLQTCILMLELIFRDALVICSGGSNCISCSEDCAKELVKSLDTTQLMKLIDTVRMIMSQVQKHANNNLTITRLCSTLIQAVQN